MMNVVLFAGNIALFIFSMLCLTNSYTPPTNMNYVRRRILLFYLGVDFLIVSMVRTLYTVGLIDQMQVSLINGIIAVACLALVLIEMYRHKDKKDLSDTHI